MRQYAIKLQNVPYSERLSLINLLKSKGEHIYKFSAIDDKGFTYLRDTVFVYTIDGNCWLSDSTHNYNNIVSIPEFIRLHSVTFKEL